MRARLYEAFQVLDPANARDVYVPGSALQIALCQYGTTLPIAFSVYASHDGTVPIDASSVSLASPYTLELFAEVPSRVTLVIDGVVDLRTAAFVYPEDETYNKYNPVLYGAQFDARRLASCTLGAGTSVLSVTPDQLTPDDVGKRVVVERASSETSYLQTTVASRQSATQVTLADSATVGVTGATVYVHGAAYFDGVMTAGSKVLTSATASFQPADVGPGGFIVVAGAATLPLCTEIVSVVGGAQAVLADAGQTSVVGVNGWCGTDDSAAINAAITAAAAAGGGRLQTDGGGTCHAPLGRAMVASTVFVAGEATSLVGVGAFAEPPAILTEFGTTLVAASLDMTVLEIAGDANEVRGLAVDGAFGAALVGIRLGSAAHNVNHDGLHQMLKVTACQTGMLLDYEHYGTEITNSSVKHCGNGIIVQETGGLGMQKVVFHNVRSENNVLGVSISNVEHLTYELGTVQFNAAIGMVVTNAYAINIIGNQLEGNGQVAINLTKPAPNSDTPALISGLIAGNSFFGGAATQVAIQSNGSSNVRIAANRFVGFPAGALSFVASTGNAQNSGNYMMLGQRFEGGSTLGTLVGIVVGEDTLVGYTSVKGYWSLEQAYAPTDPRTGELIWRTYSPNGLMYETGRIRATTQPYPSETVPRSKLEVFTTGTSPELPGSGGEHLSLTVPENGGLVVGRGAPLPNGATHGFFWVPYVNGTPGVPVDQTAYAALGAVAMCVDPATSKLYVRIGGTWKSVTLS